MVGESGGNVNTPPAQRIVWASGSTSIVYDAREGPGKGNHIVLLSGDEEYRGEEGLLHAALRYP